MNEEFNDKRLLILGGSRISCEIVKRARNMGIITGVTDWYPLEYSPAKGRLTKRMMSVPVT